MRSGLLTAVVVNWSSGHHIQHCVASLNSQTRRPDRIIVVDNASTDGSLSSLAHFGTSIEILRLDCNVGFAAGNNAALKIIVDCDWVALLNPDAFAERDWLERMLEAAEANPEFSCFASRMLSHDDPSVLDGAGDVYHFTGLAWRRAHGHKAYGHFVEYEEVFSACAGAALYRRDALTEIGGFDEAFFCYMEDVDLGFRLRLRGHRCLYVPAAIVQHVGSGSTGKESDLSVYYGHRNLVWTFFKNMPASLLVPFLLPHVFANLYIVIRYMMRGQTKIVLSAKWNAIKDLRRVFQQRKQVQETKTSSAWSLARLLSYRPYRY